MKGSLPDEFKTYITIKIHDIPLNASAFLIDYENEQDLRLLIDYKIYNRERERSYGIEFTTGSLSCTLCDSYKEISKKAKPYKELVWMALFNLKKLVEHGRLISVGGNVLEFPIRNQQARNFEVNKFF